VKVAEAVPQADLGAVLRALGAPARREILTLVWDRDRAAGEIAAAFALTPATISEHLRVLRQAGLVEMTRVGTSRRYRARPEALTGLHGMLEGPAKWQVADAIPERRLARTETHRAVVASVEVPTGRELTFAAFTDPAVYSRWLGVPVSLEEGRFSATMEWGTEIRGRYELVVPPELVVMSWDFDDGNVPVPGRPLTGYLRLFAEGNGTRVEVHQLVETAEQAEFMDAAWGLVLGRLKEGVVAATDPGAPAARRAPRPKRRAAGTARDGG
jgi:DNA-binding transcriptional ArsR family regulator